MIRRRAVLLTVAVLGAAALVVGIAVGPGRGYLPVAPLVADRDRVRLEHLLEAAALVERHHSVTGRYPLAGPVPEDHASRLVRLVSASQARYITPDSICYDASIDNNPNGHFLEHTIEELRAAIEGATGAPVSLGLDPGSADGGHVVGLHYFVVEDGYLLWTPCRTCGVTPASTVLLDGATTTVNVAGGSLLGQVPKAWPLNQLRVQNDVRGWLDRAFDDERAARTTEPGHCTG